MAEAPDLSRQKLERVFTTQDELEARMIQSLLRDAGIESMIQAEVAPGLFPSKMGNFGKQELFVLESEVPEAGRVIAEYREGREPAE